MNKSKQAASWVMDQIRANKSVMLIEVMDFFAPSNAYEMALKVVNKLIEEKEIVRDEIQGEGRHSWYTRHKLFEAGKIK